MSKSIASSVGLPLESIEERHGLTNVQLECEIKESDMACLAQHFDNTEMLVCVMELTAADKAQVESIANKETAILRCLQFWKRRNPSQATYRALLYILLRLKRGDIAEHIGQYLAAENKNSAAVCTPQSHVFQSENDRSPSTSTTSSGIESSMNLPTCVTFDCGCDECSILSHIHGRDVCKNLKLPTITISSPDPPYPEDRVTRTTISYNYFMKALEKETDKIHRCFCDLLRNTFNAFQNEDFHDIREYIFDCLTRNKRFDSAPGLLELQNFSEVRRYLIVNFCSWYNYELVMNLREKFLSLEGEDYQALQYLQSFQKYVKQRCFLYLDNLGNQGQEIETVEVTCKLDQAEFETITHDELIKAKVAFIEIMDQMPEFAAPVKQVREGCVKMVFRVPACFKEITSLTSIQIEQLQNNGISDDSVGGKQLMKVSHRPVVDHMEMNAAPDHELATAPDCDFTTTPDCDITMAPNQNLTMAPDHDLATAPDRDLTTTPDCDLIIAPDQNLTMAPDRDLATTPDYDLAMAPDCDLATAPDHDLTMAPDCDLTMAPDCNLAMAPDHNLTRAPDHDLTLAPDRDLITTPDFDLTMAPDWDLTTTRDFDLTTAPDCDLTTAPDCDLTMAPDCDFAIAPNCDLTTAPDCDLIMAPDHGLTMVPDHDHATAPDHDLTMASNYDLTMVPDHDLTAAPDCDNNNNSVASSDDSALYHSENSSGKNDDSDSVISTEFSVTDSAISSGDDSDGEQDVNINYALLRAAPSTENLTSEQGYFSVHTAVIDDYKLVLGVSDQQAAKDKEKKLAEQVTQLKQAVFEGNLQEIKHQVGDINEKVKDELLLLAVKKGQTEIIRFFLNEQHCDPNIRDKDGKTPLALAQNKETIQLLLQHGAIAQDVYTEHRKTLGKIFSKDPLKNPVKMFVIGHGGAGKSTLIEALEHEPTFWTSLASIFTGPKEVKGVDKRTAGIIPRTFKSRYYGDVQFYDFAGQEAYYSSHAAVIKSAVDTSSPIFVFVIDFSKEDNNITLSVCYWLGIIADQCGNMEGKALLIVVGSHADQIKDQSVIDRKKQIILQAVNHFPLVNLAEIIPLDCRFSNSDGMKTLRRSVGTSCDSVRAKLAISLNSHMLLIYLLDNYPNEVAITLKELTQKIELDTTSEEISIKCKQTLTFIPTTIPRLVEICVQLSDKGHILFLHNTSSPDKSSIIIDKLKLLAKVNGTMFAPEDFKQHCKIATSTGVVPEFKLAQYFPEIRMEVLIGFLSHLELAIPIEDKEVLRLINFTSTTYSEGYLFCPALIRLTVAENVFRSKEHLIYQFGWMLSCSKDDDFFTARFLHVLLLRMAFSLNLTSLVDPDLPALQRQCSFWQTGVSWKTNDNIEVLVEVIHKKRVIALFQAPEASLELFQLRYSVITKIVDTAREFCPSTIFDQLIISPHEVNYPLFDFTKVFSLKSVADSIVNQKAHIVSTTGTMSLATADLIEVYSYLGRGILQRLFTGNQKTQKRTLSNRFLLSLAACWTRNPFLENIIRTAIAKEIPAQSSECTSLEHVLKIWRDNTDATYKSFRQILDLLSIFVGQNPLELVGIPPSEMNDDLMQTVHSNDIPYCGALGGGLTIEDLKRRTGVSDTQLDTEILAHDIPFLADCFEDVKIYTSALGLTPVQQMDIGDLAFHRGTQSAMAMALKLWHIGNPFVATFKALLQIILTLRRVDVAIIVCKYIVDNVSD